MSLNDEAARILDSYQPGVQAWISDDEQGWLCMTIEKCEPVGTDQVKISFKCQGENDIRVETFQCVADQLPPLRNPSVLEGVDDLTQLSYLHEPAVLNTIKLRYQQQMIYTYSGIVLIAVNPFARLPLYSPAMVHAYRGKDRNSMEPHVFMVAEEAWTQMKRMSTDQSIIVSGESGAGKTVSAKYIMRYLTAVAHRNEGSSSPAMAARHHQSHMRRESTEWETTPIEERVLATNPILEAFGNAKTTRNNNSSRFGKYIQIQFGAGSEIVGASIRTYLLEKSRVVFQPDLERNYHIFYQLCLGAPSAERKELGLLSPTCFAYLNPSLAEKIHNMKDGSTTKLIPSIKETLDRLETNELSDMDLGRQFWIIPGVDDKEDFQQTCEALSSIGLSLSTQWSVFRILAAVLHCGNVIFSSASDGCNVANGDEYLAKLSSILEIDGAKLRDCFIKKQVRMRRETIFSPRTLQQGMAVRDAMAKHLYHSLFTWLVQKVNVCLKTSNANAKHFIGVLDIYGFEHFKRNSIEQLCINFANEKLQQEFTQHVFKLEQDEYLKEKIEWRLIDFQDNQPCIDLIEGKLGIMDLLDEETRLPSGSDPSFAQKMYKQFENQSEKTKFFSKPRFAGSGFIVHHYAYAVEYSADGFIDKNRDTVPDEMLTILRESSNSLCKELFPKPEDSVGTVVDTGSKKSVAKITLVSEFKSSLSMLMATVRSTNVHYIRCIKPNEQNVAFEIDNCYVLHQLRACGVLETIRMSCAGYPGRWGHREFINRYRILAKNDRMSPMKTPHDLCKAVLNSVLSDSNLYQIGLTKVFLRAGQLAFLEKRRNELMNRSATIIQKYVRRWLIQKRYRSICEAVVVLQAYVRGWKARKQARELRHLNAAIVIQKYWRGFATYRRFHLLRDNVILLQSCVRGWLARTCYRRMQQENAAIIIQTQFRGYLARKEYTKARHDIVVVQSCFRRRQARKQLRQLRTEARSITHFQAKTGALEKKVFELTQVLAREESKNVRLRESVEVAEKSVLALKSREEKFLRELSTFKETTAKKILLLEHDLNQSKNETLEWKEKYENIFAQLREQQELVTIIQQEKIQLEKSVATQENSDYAGIDSERMRLLQQENTQLKDKIAKAFGAKSRLSIVSSHTDADSKDTASKSRRRFSLESKSLLSDGKEEALIGKTPSVTAQNTIQSPLVHKSEPSSASLIRPLTSPALDQEIFEYLWTKSAFSLIATNSDKSPSSVLFPAHVFGAVLVSCLQLRLGDRVRTLLSQLLKQILRILDARNHVNAVICLSNVFELTRIIHTIQDEHFSHRHRIIGTAETERILAKYRGDLEYLFVDMYQQWMAEIRRELEDLVIPAVIEFQGLPGYVDSSSDGFFEKWMGSSSTSPKIQVSIEKMVNWLSNLLKITVEYHFEENARRQLFISLIRQIGIICFNYLLARKKFCTWKRGMQIQYNTTCLEEWCVSHAIGEASLHLEPLMQIAKLLQLNKKSAEDLDLMMDVCFLLTPSQMKRILVMYQPAEFESPVSSALMLALSEKCIEDKDRTLYLEGDDAGFVWPAFDPVDHLKPFITDQKMPTLEEIVSSYKQ